MRQFSFYAICLALCLGGTASAQQGLVEYQDKDDPCATFKMRILVPGNRVDDINRRAQKLGDGIDRKMVWNPCHQPQQQFALVLPQRAPHQFGKLPAFGAHMWSGDGGKKTQARFQLPRQPSPFDKLLRQ